MAYVPIDPNTIKVGDPITKELWDRIKDNFDDIDTRLDTALAGSGKVSLLNEDVMIGLYNGSAINGAFYYEVIQDCLITEGAIQLFSKNGIVTGNLTVDVKKNSSTNPTGFNSVFSVLPTFAMSTAADYQRTVGTINPSNQALVVGDILRVDITSLPTDLPGFRIVLIGEF